MGYFLLNCAKSCGKPVVGKSFLVQSILAAAQSNSYNMLVILKSLFNWSKQAVMTNSSCKGVFKSPPTVKCSAETYRRNANSESKRHSTTPSRCLSPLPSNTNSGKATLFLNKPFTHKTCSNKLDTKYNIRSSIFKYRLFRIKLQKKANS